MEETIIELVRRRQYEACKNYEPGPGGFSCLNYHLIIDADIKDVGLRNPIVRDTLCGRCSARDLS